MSISPIFDQLSARRRPVSHPIDRAATPVLASLATRATAPKGAAPSTPEREQDLVAEMSGTVARLILQLLDDESASTRRRAPAPAH